MTLTDRHMTLADPDWFYSIEIEPLMSVIHIISDGHVPTLMWHRGENIDHDRKEILWSQTFFVS